MVVSHKRVRRKRRRKVMNKEKREKGMKMKRILGKIKIFQKMITLK